MSTKRSKNIKTHKCRSDEKWRESISKRKIDFSSSLFFFSFGLDGSSRLIILIFMYNNAFGPFYREKRKKKIVIHVFGRPSFSEPAQSNAMPIDDTDIFPFLFKPFVFKFVFFLHRVVIQWRLVLFDKRTGNKKTYIWGKIAMNFRSCSTRFFRLAFKF